MGALPGLSRAAVRAPDVTASEHRPSTFGCCILGDHYYWLARRERNFFFQHYSPIYIYMNVFVLSGTVTNGIVISQQFRSSSRDIKSQTPNDSRSTAGRKRSYLRDRQGVIGPMRDHKCLASSEARWPARDQPGRLASPASQADRDHAGKSAGPASGSRKSGQQILRKLGSPLARARRRRDHDGESRKLGRPRPRELVSGSRKQGPPRPRELESP